MGNRESILMMVMDAILMQSGDVPRACGVSFGLKTALKKGRSEWPHPQLTDMEVGSMLRE